MFVYPIESIIPVKKIYNGKNKFWANTLFTTVLKLRYRYN